MHRESKPSTKGEGGSGTLAGLRILLLDDDAATRNSFADLLEVKGASVVSADSVAEALSLFRLERPNFLLSDISMPNRDGLDLIRQLRSMPSGAAERIPAIAITAFYREMGPTAAIEAGFQACLPKPVDLPELFRLLDSLRLK